MTSAEVSQFEVAEWIVFRMLRAGIGLLATAENGGPLPVPFRLWMTIC
jgi:hypothetical protein